MRIYGISMNPWQKRNHIWCFLEISFRQQQPTWARMFCSLMSFCLSLFGVEVTTDRTSCPLLGTTHTKKTRSSSSFVTNLIYNVHEAKNKSIYTKNLHHSPVWLHTEPVSSPPLILSNVAIQQLSHSGLQNLAGIIGKIQVSDLRQWNRHNGKSFFVFFSRAGANLEWCEHIFYILNPVSEQVCGFINQWGPYTLHNQKVTQWMCTVASYKLPSTMSRQLLQSGAE